MKHDFGQTVYDQKTDLTRAPCFELDRFNTVRFLYGSNNENQVEGNDSKRLNKLKKNHKRFFLKVFLTTANFEGCFHSRQKHWQCSIDAKWLPIWRRQIKLILEVGAFIWQSLKTALVKNRCWLDIKKKTLDNRKLAQLLKKSIFYGA